MRLKFFLFFFIITILISKAQSFDPLITQDSLYQKHWVDSLYSTYNLREKIGQLFMINAPFEYDKQKIRQLKKLIEKNKIGGVIFFKGSPHKQVTLTNELQSISQTPLLIGIDAEWGLAMRLDSTFAYPWNMTLGAVKNNELIEKIGYRIGEHAKRMGIHINFAPDVDINNNPENPIIGNRSFGEDRENVAQKGQAFTRGMQKAGVLACAKHFPGHGDTNVDSHKSLPTIPFSPQRLDSLELYPFKQLIRENLASVMIAHLNVPALEPRNGYPSSISENIVTNLLKESLNFKGLIFTDALNMKGASNFTSPGDIDLEAFLAGNDVLLFSEDVETAINKIEGAYYSGKITESRLEHSVKKILRAKYKTGLNNYRPVSTYNLYEDLNTIEDSVLLEEVVENTITVVKNDLNLLPVKNLENKKIAYVKFGDDEGSDFLNMLKNYTKVNEVSGTTLDTLLMNLKSYNLVVIGFHKSNESPWKDYKFTDKEKVWLYEIARKKNVILDVFAKPYSLLDLQTITNIESIVVSYQNSKVFQEKSAQVIFGGLSAKGKLPVTAHKKIPINTGFDITSISRLSYGLPESVGVDSKKLAKIDSVAKLTIDKIMAPGMQILVARKGKVIYNKNFGRYRYFSGKTVESDDVYDLASLTKILATLPTIMKMEENKQINFSTTLSEMFPELKNTNKAKITLLDMLSHYARLKPWIPFYLSTLDPFGNPDTKYYKNSSQGIYNVKVAENLYIREDYKDSIYKQIEESELLRRLRYRYSDLPYFFLKKYIEKTYNRPLDELVQEQIYKPLGANYTTFKPLEKFSKGKIVPSEVDTYFRHQTLQGYVHDMAAAMLGGVGGHAGLFSNANDVAKIMQMYLQKGYYGGKRYFNTYTIDKFNTCYFCSENNRRGVGFDKPQLGDVGPTCGCVSMTSFGHSGFTGTYTWADPEQEIVYVFLSNRTYPTMENNKLISKAIRTDIQQLIYDSIYY
ncbi:glycoside hydrolase family 3 N-terminal domain-containing protein [Abyssalbus ytuae]|uniref:beta-N-acetylhexosaminidase n=1 Tax=Abyssalbus ytuae TaxID=2926907 RepID=A0A9E7D3U2_9FLAO|nr:glycoside hydrolase family 3 N-terminal domain-containing protein [Abyssalbus ytuae]UOB18204.1 serine hydrolase [Abyssalbus ytuae]